MNAKLGFKEEERRANLLFEILINKLIDYPIKVG